MGRGTQKKDDVHTKQTNHKQIVTGSSCAGHHCHRFHPKAIFTDLSARDRPRDNADVVYDFIGIHDRLQPVGNHEQRHTRSEIGTERMLDDCVRPAVDG